MSRLHPDMVTRIGGQRCVILRDVIAHKLPAVDEVVVLGNFAGNMIYCALSELQRVRGQYPGVPAYGFWQTLACSDLVDKTHHLQAVYFDQDNGQYLYQDEIPAAFTGEIRSGRLIPAAGYVLDSGAVRTITCDTKNLRLPEKAALSFEEYEHRRAARRFRLAVQFATLVICVAASLLVYNGRLRAHAAEQQQARAVLAARVESLEAREAYLRQTRVGEAPEQRGAFDDLLQLVLSVEQFTLPETSLERSAFEVRLPPAQWSPLLAATTHIVEHRRDGFLSLRWRHPQ